MKHRRFINTALQQLAEHISRSNAEALIPEEVSKEIVEGVREYSTVMRLATKAPNMSTKQRRVPVLSSLPTAYFVAANVQGFVSSNFKLRAIFVPLISLTRTVSLSPTLNTFFGCSIRPHDISEM